MDKSPHDRTAKDAAVQPALVPPQDQPPKARAKWRGRPARPAEPKNAGSRDEAIESLKAVGFKVTSITDVDANSGSLQPLIKLGKFKSPLKEEERELRAALKVEFRKAGLPSKLADKAYSTFKAFEERPSTPPIGEKLRQRMPVLLANIAAISFSKASTEQPLFADRDVEISPSAEAFLKQAYGDRLGINGDLTQADVGRLDPQLLTALNAEFTGERRAELRKLLPTTKERNDALLLQRYGYIPEGDDRKKKVTVLARHKP